MEKIESLALEIRNAMKLSNRYVSDSDVEDNVGVSSTPSNFRNATKVKKKSSVGGEDVQDTKNNMLRILLPQLFEKKYKKKNVFFFFIC